MKQLMFLFLFLLTFTAVLSQQHQYGDVLYFAESYDAYGEHGVSNRFYTGPVTVMVRLAAPIYYNKVMIQLDKFNPRTNEFSYFSRQEFSVNSKDTYICFRDILFTEAGFYRVFLLSPDKNTITSGVVEIVRGYLK